MLGIPLSQVILFVSSSLVGGCLPLDQMIQVSPLYPGILLGLLFLLEYFYVFKMFFILSARH